MKISVNKHKLFSILFFIFMSLVCLKYLHGIFIPNWIFLLGALIISFAGNQNHIIAMCMCCIPLSAALEIYQIIGTCLIVYVIKHASEFKVGTEYFLIVFLLIWEILHCIGENVNLISAIVFIFPYILCALIIRSNMQKIDYFYICKIFALCTLCMCFILIGKMIKDAGYNIGHALSNMNRFGMFNSTEGDGVYINPNALGYFCLLSVIGLIQKIKYSRKCLSEILISGILIIFGMFTLSRTYIVCLTITMLLFLLSDSKSLKDKSKNLLVLGSLAIVIGVILYKVFPDVLNNLMLRFSSADISGGRVHLFKMYNQYIGSSIGTFMWGTGLVARKIKLNNYFGVSDIQVPHNGFQELVVVWGLLGAIAWFIFMVIIFLKSRKINPHQKVVNYIPLIILIIKIQAGQMVSSYYTMLMFPLALLSLCNDFKQRR